MRRAELGLLLCCTVSVLAVTSVSRAQWTLPQRIELGGGLAVERMCPPLTVRSRVCLGWRPEGFAFGDSERWLTFAGLFARVPVTGRIVAVPGRPTESPYPSAPPRMLRSDDGGQHWVEVAWPGGPVPSVIAFDNLTHDGVAAGESGHVWTSADAGEHWTDHGGDARVWTSVAIANGEIVLVDSTGDVFRSHDGGFARERVPIDDGPVLDQRDHEILVRTDTSECIVRHGDGVRCTTRR